MKDPFRYFRIESQELLEGLTSGVLSLERQGATEAGITYLLRLAHTLKGAARVVNVMPAADLAHQVEDALAPYRQKVCPVPHETIQAILGLLDSLAGTITAADAGSRTALPAMASGAVDEETTETVRVEIAALDGLLESLSEARIQVDALDHDYRALDGGRRMATRVLERLTGTRRGKAAVNPQVRGEMEALAGLLNHLAQGMETRIRRADREIGDALARVGDLRLLPASTLFGQLERAIRDAADAQGKRVRFVASGGDIRVDGHGLSRLRDALLHVVRNAVAHGIEPEAQRVAAGKAPEGRILLTVSRQGRHVIFACDDDGQGIDIQAVRDAAVRNRLVSREDVEDFAIDDVVRLVFAAGLTTNPTLTEVSGRGIGLDVVRDVAEALRGEVRVMTAAGRGTTFEIDVPISLAVMEALVFQVSGTTAAIPLSNVRRTVRVVRADLALAAGATTLLVDDVVVPYLHLAAILASTDPVADARDAWSAIILEVDGRLAAIGVDTLVGAAELLVKPLPRNAGSLPLLSGAALDAEGHPVPVLEPRTLAETARTARMPERPARPVRLPILVVDDSLTTRMLEQGILEAAGYEVDLATSGDEGLEMARQRRYGLFIVDVEMPGMTGFEFVEATRRDPLHATVPAIMVTSRSSAADRRRGVEVGAKAYIVKGEFDQGKFLAAVRDHGGPS